MTESWPERDLVARLFTSYNNYAELLRMNRRAIRGFTGQSGSLFVIAGKGASV
jgi:hypothetical protein